MAVYSKNSDFKTAELIKKIEVNPPKRERTRMTDSTVMIVSYEQIPWIDNRRKVSPDFKICQPALRSYDVSYGINDFVS